MGIERKPGLPILAGTLPKAGVVVTLQSPVGGTAKKLSGSKPEHGVGGFEFWTPYRGTYTLLFLDQSFEIPLDGRYTFVTFTEGGPGEGEGEGPGEGEEEGPGEGGPGEGEEEGPGEGGPGEGEEEGSGEGDTPDKLCRGRIRQSGG